MWPESRRSALGHEQTSRHVRLIALFPSKRTFISAAARRPVGLTGTDSTRYRGRRLKLVTLRRQKRDRKFSLMTGPFGSPNQHRALCLIVFGSFVARLLLANSTSLWYDDLLSIVMYGTSHATLSAAIATLAEQSATPPLYHVVLFEWMRIFGDSELATRTLSNLYIAALPSVSTRLHSSCSDVGSQLPRH